jgi:hypothetical protein
LPISSVFPSNPSPVLSQHFPLCSPLDTSENLRHFSIPLATTITDSTSPSHARYPDLATPISFFPPLPSPEICSPPHLSCYLTSSLSSPPISSFRHSCLSLNHLPCLAVPPNYFSNASVLKHPP